MLCVLLLLTGLAQASAPARELLQTFAAEAAARGVSVDTSRVRVRQVWRLEDAGFCRQDTHPTILLRRSTWRELVLPAREALLFHELGHCLLDRRHDNAQGPTGEWQSVMRGGATPQGKRVWIRFEGSHRARYLDALFGVAPPPQWGAALPDRPDGDQQQHHSADLWSADGRVQLLPVEGFRAASLDLAAGAGAGKGLLYSGSRTLYLALTPEDGLSVGTLEDARPWTNLPQGASTLWMFHHDGMLWVGADEQPLMVVPIDELGPPTRIGAYSTGNRPLDDGDVLTITTAP